MPSSKRHLFFDLDRTLWDFDKNSENALRQIFHEEELEARIGGFEHFHQQYVYQNAHLWKLYGCLLYTSDAADEEDSVDLGGRRIIKKKKFF